ncbi:hypothetical protein B1L04_28955 [Microcystis aeruginosa KW]|uniref:Uncharacterized protein n=1 Tax=Microcystis aeruginosa KW TaxID=1960155 RepID=A0A1V4BL94_MICAE|nr:hypothetical protein B1L04_28955 [Microcystis aeruginosa KW]
MGRSISLVKADFLPQCNLSRCFLTSAGSFSRLTSASLPAFIEMLHKNDCYKAFTKMVQRGDFPSSLDALILDSQED